MRYEKPGFEMTIFSDSCCDGLLVIIKESNSLILVISGTLDRPRQFLRQKPAGSADVYGLRKLARNGPGCLADSFRPQATSDISIGNPLVVIAVGSLPMPKS